MVFVGFDNFPNYFINILIFVTLGDIFWFYSATFFNNSDHCKLSTFCKLFFTSYSFISLNKCNIFFAKNFLFVRNGLMKVQKFLFVMMPLFCNVVEERFCFFLVRHTGFFVFNKLLCFYGRIFVHFVFISNLCIIAF